MRLSGIEITASTLKCGYRESKSRFRRQNAVIGSRNHGFDAKVRLSGVEITVSGPKCGYRESKSRFRRQNAVIRPRVTPKKGYPLFARRGGKVEMGTPPYFSRQRAGVMAPRPLRFPRGFSIGSSTGWECKGVLFWRRNRNFDSR